jgi:hypothetical protein
MISLWIGLALAEAPRNCEAPLSVYIEEVQTSGSELAYLCLADRDDAGKALLDALAAMKSDAVGDERVSRALAVHLLHRLNRPITGAEARALSPADRRFLADGVYARRGRRSPALEHERVFEKFPWYQPDAGYTNARLTPEDRANIEILDDPPKRPLAARSPSAGDAIANGEETPTEAPSPCACGSLGAASALPALLGGLLALRRRRR